METFELHKTPCPRLNTQGYHKEGMSLGVEKEKGGREELNVYWVATDQLAGIAILTLYMKMCVGYSVALCPSV